MLLHLSMHRFVRGAGLIRLDNFRAARIAAKHYLQVPDEVYAKAAQNARTRRKNRRSRRAQWGSVKRKQTRTKAAKTRISPLLVRKRGPQKMNVWRRGDSNPRPEMFQDKLLRA